MGYVFLAMTFSTTLLSQLIVKHFVDQLNFPENLAERIFYSAKLLISWPIAAAILLTFISGLAWINTIANIPLSRALPILMLILPTILIIERLFYQHTLSLPTLLGTSLIIIGVFFVLHS